MMKLQNQNLIDGLLLLEMWNYQTAEALRVRNPDRLRLVAESIEIAAPNLDGRARVKALALVARVQAGLRYLDAV